ncbi:MAG TPA: periplasmic heavy metal sensor [Burkholderiales bacterium]|nr:periplasmic heavy metal sensor [Burkholderiales bacterium]
MKRLTTTLAATLFCLSAGYAFAQQGPGGPGGQGPGMGGPHRGMMQPCSQQADPAKCEADRKQIRENLKAAREACKSSQDKRGCMEQQYCSKQADPAKCQERANQRHARLSKRMDEHQAMAEACSGKRGDDLEKCYHEQHQKRIGAPAPAPAK